MCSQLYFNTREEIVFIHYRVCNNSPLVPIFNRMNPVRTNILYLLKMHFIIILPSKFEPSKRSLSFKFSGQKPGNFLSTHSCK